MSASLGILIARPVATTVGLALAILVFLLLRCTWLLFFHPLRRFPGPKLWALSRWPITNAVISGKSHDVILNLHKRYGPIVRVAPNELAFQALSAWNDIGGHRKAGQQEMGKEAIFNEAFKDNLLGVRTREDHSRMRKALSRGFSAASMQKQEPILKTYIDKLLSALHERCNRGVTPIDIAEWYSFTAFDIIGDLVFGESFGSLDAAGHNPWVSFIFETTRMVILTNCLKRMSRLLLPAVLLVTPKDMLRKFRENVRLQDAKIAKRRLQGTERPDYMSAMISEDGKSPALTEEEVRSNCTALILGGSETITTALSSATYYLGLHPEKMQKVVSEILGTFSSEAEITGTSTNSLKYLNAVIAETLRLCPPFAGASPRTVPPGGAVIAGAFVPANTDVGIWHWSMTRCPEFFRFPDEFHPERWLDDPRFDQDKKQASQPFAVGPRNCIGLNLAQVELRLILARILWNFEVRLDPGCANWLEELVEYFGWEKKPLLVYLQSREK